jgi:phosphoglycerol transferase MdoB-like AlkP superfamily enzyme
MVLTRQAILFQSIRFFFSRYSLVFALTALNALTNTNDFTLDFSPPYYWILYRMEKAHADLFINSIMSMCYKDLSL